MNRKLLSLLVALVAMFGYFGSANAQNWIGEVPTAGKNYYIYNVAAKKFLTGNSNSLVDAGASNLYAWLPAGGIDSKFTFSSLNNGYRIGQYWTAGGSIIGQYKIRVDRTSGAEEFNLEKQNDGSYLFRFNPASRNAYMSCNSKNSIDMGVPMDKPDNRSYWYLISEEQYNNVMNNSNKNNDRTYYIWNPSFETGDLSGWTAGAEGDTGVKPNSNGTYAINNINGNYLFNTWNGDVGNFSLTHNEVSGLENGYYKLTAIVGSNAGNSISLTANGEISTITTQTDNSANNNDAAEHIEVIFKVTEGKLNFYMTSNNWFKCDNFNLGIVPGPVVQLNPDETAWVMTGTWIASDMDMLNTTISANPKLLLDASDATIAGKPTIPVPDAVPNMMIKVANADDVANTQNVIANGECAHFVLTDKKDFAPLENFTAKKISYTRSNTAGYNTVCMPFALKASDLAGTCTAYSFVNKEEGIINFEDKGAGELISAGTPILVEDTGSEWTVNISENRNVVANAGSEGIVEGAFIKRTLGEGFYKLNSAGTEFVHSTSSSTITPFRFFVNGGSSSEVKSFVVKFVKANEETAIKGLQKETATDGVVYDLMGRKVAGAVRPGIYIKGGKKVMIK